MVREGHWRCGISMGGKAAYFREGCFNMMGFLHEYLQTILAKVPWYLIAFIVVLNP